MIPTLALNDGNRIPAIGLGTWPMNEEAPGAVRTALELGYRLIDTAAKYENEEAVGQGIVESGVPREQIVVTTKLRGADQGYESTLRAFETSRRKLGLEYIDLYLIHWPLPRVDKYVDSWRAMVKLREDGVVRSIGVSNFTAAHLDRIIAETDVAPAVNQIELHPYFTQAEQRAADTERTVLTESWSPLARNAQLLSEPAVEQIAARHEVENSQVVLRWHIQLGVVPIPKSASPDRQSSNLDVFGFELSDSEMRQISALDRGRHRLDPDTHEEF
ncbi:aldo/keto reductase [Georgenia sp. H159]|uniref:aldo/keto reductase n=1 Tax=Georgenia sp. H159 TaxID=3076115 RepID=UPI002D79FF73|nr:aldo/keto reductase [Georgenia sp. H159]